MKRNQRSLAVLLAAIAFLFQSVLSIAATAAMPLGPQLDVFGNPLCITGTVSGDGSSEPAVHKVPGCCLFGCNLVHHDVDHPLLASQGIHRPLEQKVQALEVREYSVFSQVGHDPGSPRAPPVNG